MKSFIGNPPLGPPPAKVWKPKCKNRPILPSYPRKLPISYWQNWNKRSLAQVLPAKSWVSSGEFRKLCAEVGYHDKEKLDRVCKRLEFGAYIG